jgi:hypothetical protein
VVGIKQGNQTNRVTSTGSNLTEEEGRDFEVVVEEGGLAK